MNVSSARLLDGNRIAGEIRQSVAPGVAAFTSRHGRAPQLGIVLVAEDPASEIYVRNKVRAGHESGLLVDLQRLPATATLDELLQLVRQLNASDVHDGILVQAPLPATMGRGATQRVFDTIDPAKDVDGFHPANVGRLVQGRAHLAPCTPSGVIEMLDRSGIAIARTHAVVIGRSDIVGKPMAMLLLQRDATVTVCHSKTTDLPSVARQADILVAAIGRAAFVTADFVKPGATVIDVGINRLTDAAQVTSLFGAGAQRVVDFQKRGSIVVGDVHPAVAEVAGALTPVPGGVGPLTIAVLLKNTLAAAEGASGGALVAMVRAALTGGIATGKSHCLARFAALGVPTIDADLLARDAVAPGSPGLQAVAARFGPAVMRPDGALDRPALGTIVFADRTARAALEAIIHPEVRRRIREWFVALPPQTALAIADIPLLFETGQEHDFDRVIVCACDPAEQLRRVITRNDLSEEAARQRLAAQWPIDEKVARAHHVIRTDGTFADTESQVRAVYETLNAEL